MEFVSFRKGGEAMDFRQLQYLTAVAECRNVTKAAEALYISQSALSHYISKTEKELGVSLFDRSTVPISLTYAGKCYIESAQRILLEKKRLMKELREITEHRTGLLRIGTSRDRASYLLPRLLREFKALYPEIQVDIFTESAKQLREALKTGRIDLLFLPADGREEEPSIAFQTIYTEELVLCAARGVVKPEERKNTCSRVIDPHSLHEKPFFLLRQEHAIRTFCDSFFRIQKIRPVICNEFSSSITCYRMAAAGLGFAIVPYMITQLADSGMEAELFSLEEKPVTWEVNLYYRRDAYLGQPERDLIQLSKELFQQECLHGSYG